METARPNELLQYVNIKSLLELKEDAESNEISLRIWYRLNEKIRR